MIKRILTIISTAILLVACSGDISKSYNHKSSSDKALQIIILGAPGVGKGINSAMLSNRYHIPQLSTGDILRMEVKNKTILGLKAESYMKNGQLVPDDLILNIIKKRVHEQDCSDGFILDGFPRTITQAEGLDKILTGLPKGDLIVVNLKADEEQLINRMKKRALCGKCNSGLIDHIQYSKLCSACNGDEIIREDDKEEIIRKRLSIYNEETKPTIEYYRSKSGFFEIEANIISQTFNSIIAVIDKRVGNVDKNIMN